MLLALYERKNPLGELRYDDLRNRDGVGEVALGHELLKLLHHFPAKPNRITDRASIFPRNGDEQPQDVFHVPESR